MAKPSNRQIAEKADLAVSTLVGTGGYLNPIQANAFIRMLIDQPTIINQIRVVPMNAPTMEINKIGFGQRILHKAPTSGTALAAGDRSAPTTDQVTLTTKEVIAEVHIPYDVLEDNIERGVLEDTIMSLIAERASLDLEELIIMGNTALSGSDAYLGLMDGILIQADQNVVDFSSTMPQISKAVFKAGMKAMPNKYMRNRAAMKFWVSPNAEIEWLDSLANRETVLGDNKTVTFVPTPAYGIPVESAALMPDENYILTYPKNVILGVQRQIMIETDRDIRARVLIVVLTMRLDMVFEEVDAVVLCEGLNPNDVTTTT
jgi:hypothetical protein